MERHALSTAQTHVGANLRDETARETLTFLQTRPGSSNMALALNFGISPVAAYKRLEWLRSTGLVESKRNGKAVSNRLTSRGEGWLIQCSLSIRDRVRQALENGGPGVRTLARNLQVAPSTISYHRQFLRGKKTPGRRPVRP